VHIDHEIHEVEQRLAQRRLKVELLARATRRRALGIVTSPASIAGAAALGALTVLGVARRRHTVHPTGKTGLLTTLGGLAASAAMSGVMALIRAQFGGPAGLAQFLLAKIRRPSPVRRP
jgi:hypothetical protein